MWVLVLHIIPNLWVSECIMGCIDSQQPEAHFYPHVFKPNRVCSNLINTKACSSHREKKQKKTAFNACWTSIRQQRNEKLWNQYFYYRLIRPGTASKHVLHKHVDVMFRDVTGCAQEDVNMRHDVDVEDLELSLGSGQVTAKGHVTSSFNRGDTSFIHLSVHSFMHSMWVLEGSEQSSRNIWRVEIVWLPGTSHLNEAGWIQ